VVAAAVAQLRALGRVVALSRRAHGERARLVEELDQAVLPREVVAASPAMRRLFFETIPLIAGHDATVLLRGETGTGKEVAARRIHALSPRARRPFVRVNCGALPEALAESLLFGHERGAFTGAHQRHTGVFERASGGTLLLDEVGELSLAMQARLLRVIQEGEFERVGGVEAVRVDLRLIAATHRDLEGMMAEGKFRQDLYYRLHVVPIELPPLRERIEDIEGLVRETLRRLADRAGRAPPPVSAHDLERLRSWPWPGNVRELENLLERALVLSPGERIVLPMSFGPLPGRAAESTPAEGPRPAGARAATSPGEVARGASEAGGFDGGVRRLIEGALEASGGRIHGAGGAAERLGLRPTTLQAKMRKLGVKRSR
jgi:transcriptional regulator with GAF, ATPase, and Fis domain